MRQFVVLLVAALGLALAPSAQAQNIRAIGGSGGPGANLVPDVRVAFTAGGNVVFAQGTLVFPTAAVASVQQVGGSGPCAVNLGAGTVSFDRGAAISGAPVLPSQDFCVLRFTLRPDFRGVGAFTLSVIPGTCFQVLPPFNFLAPASCSATSGQLIVPAPAITTAPANGNTISLTGTQGAVIAPRAFVRVSNIGAAGSVLISDPTIVSGGTAAGTSPTYSFLPTGTTLVAAGGFSEVTVVCNNSVPGVASRNVTFGSNVGASTLTVNCSILVPPTLVFTPSAPTPIVVPATAAASTNTTINIATTGGQPGAVRGISCTAPAGFTLNVNGGNTNILTGAAGTIRIGCPPTPPAQGNLVCTQTSGGPTASWPLTCQSNPLYSAVPAAGTAITLNGTVGGPAPTATIDVTNTGTETTSLNLLAPSGLSGALSIAPATAQSVVQGAAARRYTVSCSTAAAFSGTQTLTLAHNAPGSPATYAVTCNIRTPPTLTFQPQANFAIVVPASQPVVTTSSIAIATQGGDAGENRPISCTVPSGYIVTTNGSPVPTGGSGSIAIGCGLPAPAPGNLTCNQGFGGATLQWPISCESAPAYSSLPRPSSPFGVYGAIGDLFAQGSIVVTNRGTNTLTLSNCQTNPAGIFALTLSSNVPPTESRNLTVDCTLPPVGSTTVATLTCNTNDNNRPQVLYRLACVAPPSAQVGTSASPRVRLSTPSADAGANLGTSASAGVGSGGTELIVVGAPFAGDDQAGRVFVYVRPPGSQGGNGGGQGKTLGDEPLGEPVAVLAPPRRAKGSASTLDKFGAAVTSSPDGSLIVVGAPDGGNAQIGSVFVFSEPQGGWGDLGSLVPLEIPAPTTDPNVVPSDFGNDIAFSDDGMLVIGAPGTIVDGIDGAGAAFVYSISGNSATQMGDAIVSETPSGNANFGFALDTDNGLLGIGAPGEANNTGAAYMYEFSGGTVGQGNQQTAQNGQVGDKWGTSIAVGGGAVVVGAPDDDTAAGPNSGSATVFMQGEGNTVMPLGVLVPPPGGVQGAGGAVDTNGDLIVLGAPLSDIGGQADRGTVLLYDFQNLLGGGGGGGSPSGSYENALGGTTSALTPGDQFGSAVALGPTRLVVGAPKSDEGTDLDEGRADPFVLDRIFRGGFDR